MHDGAFGSLKVQKNMGNQKMTTAPTANLTDMIGQNLPFLRRYARALTGSQDKGDNYAIATLEAVLGDLDAFDRSLEPKVALFKVFQTIWSGTGGALAS